MSGIILKLFDITDDEIERLILPFADKLNIEYETNILDTKVCIMPKNEIDESSLEFKYAIADFTKSLKKYLYSSEDKNLFAKLTEVLDVRKNNLCICEYASCGLVVAGICLSGARNRIVKSYVVNNKSELSSVFDIEPNILTFGGAVDKRVSSKVIEFLKAHILADNYVYIASNFNGDSCIGLSNNDKKVVVAFAKQDSPIVYDEHIFANMSDENLIQVSAEVCAFNLINHIENKDYLDNIRL